MRWGGGRTRKEMEFREELFVQVFLLPLKCSYHTIISCNVNFNTQLTNKGRALNFKLPSIVNCNNFT